MPQIRLFKIPFTSIPHNHWKAHFSKCYIQVRKYSYSNNVLKTFEAKKIPSNEAIVLRFSCKVNIIMNVLVIISNNTASTCLYTTQRFGLTKKIFFLSFFCLGLWIFIFIYFLFGVRISTWKWKEWNIKISHAIFWIILRMEWSRQTSMRIHIQYICLCC